MQTKKSSLIETLTNVGTGFITTLVLSPPIYWLVGVEVKYSQMGLITLLFTVVSVARGYIVRRCFNKSEITVKSIDNKDTQEYDDYQPSQTV